MARITVEDCLTKETNRFALVLLAAKRTKQILHGSKLMIEDPKNKAVVTALREIAAGKVRFMTEEERAAAAEVRQREEEAAREAAQRQQQERAAAAVVSPVAPQQDPFRNAETPTPVAVTPANEPEAEASENGAKDDAATNSVNH